MSTSEAIGRNDPCPCGSGQKYKLCCEGRQDLVQEAKKSPWLLGGAAVLGLGVVATVAMQLGDPKPSDVNRSQSPPATTQSPIGAPTALLNPIVPQEGGAAAPPGKVWSAEHGHYHDINGGELPAAAPPSGSTPTAPLAATPAILTPQPDGPVPEGKVWSPDHGHWHDAPGATPAPGTISAGELTPIPPPTGTPGTLTPQPEGPAPEGKVWSPEHGHWHDAPGATPEIKIGEGAGEIVPIPAPAGTGTTPPPTPAETPKPVDPPAPPPGTPPK